MGVEAGGSAAGSDCAFPRSGSASAGTWTVPTGSWPRSAPWPKSLSARAAPLPVPLRAPGPVLTLLVPPQSSVKLKLICAQVLRDLLGEAIEVRGPPRGVTGLEAARYNAIIS